jgi:2-oxoglutarate dehydrogenase E1 component
MLKTDKIDWSTAEALAFGSLLLEQVPVRLSGQDSQRGTFSQRHAVWIDQENGQAHRPFSQLEVYNSPLSEFACLAFEYGVSWIQLKGLNLLEAQYGDFTIGAETVIDHYLTTAEQKWARYSSLTLLLPHGYEGQGPEHSSGRIERFLQLAAKENIQVANPTTPAQYFHLLRRQALRPIKKPLVVFTPKSLLRLPACVSALSAFTQGRFEEVLQDPTPPKNPKRLLLCSGKIFYELMTQRTADVAIVRLEQLYPIHRQKLEETLRKYAGCPEVCWVQEEPENMGAWEFLSPQLRSLLPSQTTLRYIGRERSAVTATGSFRQHTQELARIFKEAFA